jgi:hypothetical protein
LDTKLSRSKADDSLTKLFLSKASLGLNRPAFLGGVSHVFHAPNAIGPVCLFFLRCFVLPWDLLTFASLCARACHALIEATTHQVPCMISCVYIVTTLAQLICAIKLGWSKLLGQIIFVIIFVIIIIVLSYYFNSPLDFGTFFL